MSGVRHEVVAWSDATLELDDSFAYAGKFRVPSGKAVSRDASGGIVAALSFSPDHADDSRARVRYFAVRDDRRGEGIGSSLLSHTADRLLTDRGYDAVRVSVNNPYAYVAAHKAGFGWTGETAGLESLVLERPPDESADTDKRRDEGLRRFTDRDLSEPEHDFLRRKLSV